MQTKLTQISLENQESSPRPTRPVDVRPKTQSQDSLGTYLKLVEKKDSSNLHQKKGSETDLGNDQIARRKLREDKSKLEHFFL